MAYWQDRMAKAQDALLGKSAGDIQKQMSKYYQKSSLKIIGQFEKTYNKVISGIHEGIKPTPADLYKLNSYWQMQGQLKHELEKLGNKQIIILQNSFMDFYRNAYTTFAKHDGLEAFSTIDTKVATQLINEIWCADGQSWKSRIWGNINRLQETLNEGLLDCVIGGRSSADLKQKLQERFNVDYNRASTIARTELAHIQTQAAKQRYLDYGLEKYKILGNEDDTCGSHGVDCHEMDGKTFYYAEMSIGVNAPPFHPNCRCCIVPVVE